MKYPAGLLACSLIALAAPLSAARAADALCASTDARTIAAAKRFAQAANATTSLGEKNQLVSRTLAPRLQIDHVPANPADGPWGSKDIVRAMTVEAAMGPEIDAALAGAGLKDLSEETRAYADGRCVVTVAIQHARGPEGELISTGVSKFYLKGDRIVGLKSYRRPGFGPKYAAAAGAAMASSKYRDQLMQIRPPKAAQK